MKKISCNELKRINGGENKEFWGSVGKAAGAGAYCSTKLGYTNLVPGATALCTYVRYKR